MKKLTILIFFSFLFLYSPNFFCQGKGSMDSIISALEFQKKDTNKVKSLIKIMAEYQDRGNLDSAEFYATIAFSTASDLNYHYGVGILNWHLGNIKEDKNEFNKAEQYFLLALNNGTQNNNNEIISRAYSALGRINEKQGRYSTALEQYLSALKICTEAKDSSGMAVVNNNLGLLFERQEDFQTALKYHFSALEIRKQINNPKGIAGSLNNIGNIYYYQYDYSKALTYYQQSVKIKEELNDKLGAAITIANIGAIFSETNKPDEAYEYFNRSLLIHKELNDNMGMAICYIHLGDVSASRENFSDARRNYELAAITAKEINFKDALKDSYLGLAQCYAKEKNFKAAYDFILKHSSEKDSLLNEESSKQIAEMQTKYETEKKELEIQNLNKDNEIKSTEIKKQNFQKLAFASGFALMLILAFVVFRGYRQKQKANRLISAQKEEVEKQKILVDEKNKSLELAYKNIEEKNHEILDSIRYAKRIQEAILPPQKLVKQHLENSFILYKPKDIVAGDFYWMHPLENKVLFASVDCTGHGVPGAFVSILGHNSLNRCVKEFGLTRPAAILDKLCELIDEAFSKSETDIKDGMDIALCSYDFTNNLIEYAGAGNSLYHIRQDLLTECKADKQPVGKYAYRKPFSNQKIELQKNDAVYIFTDGYADQFGGPKGKKFKYSQFEKLLVSIQDKEMAEQREILNKTIDKWRGDLEQIDDICIIGMKI